MKRTCWLGLLAGLLLTAVPAARADDGWKVVRDKENFQFARRQVAFSKVDEVRGVGTFDASVDRLVAVLSDVEHYPTNMPPTLVSRRLRGGGDEAWYYIELKPPMSARRYYCVRYLLKHLGGGAARIEWALDNQLCPTANGGMLRMEDNAGAWTLTPIAGGHTRVVYEAHVDPGGAIPASLVNWGTPGAINDLFAALRRAATRGQLTTARN